MPKDLIILVPFFDIFKKKGKVEPDISSYVKKDKGSSSELSGKPNIPGLTQDSDTPELAGSSSKSDPNPISIADALLLLRSREEIKVKELGRDLLPIKWSVEKLLKSTEKVADDLEKEKIKVEEPRFESIVENSRKTIVLSLRKEASTEITSITTLEDALKFEARLESIVNRFSALSGSHSRVLNAFVRKYASKLQNKSNTVSELSRKCKSKITEHEKFRESVTSTEKLLNSLLDQSNSIKNTRDTINNIRSEIKRLEEKFEAQDNELHDFEGTREYLEISLIEKESEQLEKEEQEIRQETTDLFGHVNRAITKYSYGLSTKTDLFMRLQTMANEPWQIFYHTDLSKDHANQEQIGSADYSTLSEQDKGGKTTDILQYLSILHEIQSALRNGTIELKDSEKVTYYLDQIIESLPTFNSRLSNIQNRLTFLTERKDSLHSLRKMTMLGDNIKLNKMSISEQRTRLGVLESELLEMQGDFTTLISKSQEELSNVTGQQYKIIF
jgi:hypothetical protein